MWRGAAPFAAVLVLLSHGAHAAPGGPQRYLIVPFENLSSERSLNWIGEALAMSLADRFELLGMRTVTRSERLEALDDMVLPSGAPLTLASDLKLAGAVRAGRLVAGTYDFDPNNGVVVTARLVDVKAGAQLWEGSRPGTLAGIFSLMDPVVLQAAASDEARVSAVAPSDLSSISDPPLPLYEVIVRGVLESDPDRRVAALEKGLEMNPKAPALLRALAFTLYDAGRLDDALSRLDAIPEGSAADGWRLFLLRARILLARNDTNGALSALSRSVAAGESADAHVLLALIHARRGERTRAQSELDLASGFDPGHPEIPEVKALLSGTPL